MNINIDAKVLTEALKYASCSKTTASKPLIPSVSVELQSDKMILKGIDPAALIMSVSVINKDSIHQYSDVGEVMVIDVERILRFVNSLNDNVIVYNDDSRVYLAGNGKKYSENLPREEIEFPSSINIIYKDNRPIPEIVEKNEETESKIEFYTAIRVSSKPNIPISFDTDSITITLTDKQAKIVVSDEISEYEDILSTTIKWNTEPKEFGVILNNDIMKNIFPLITEDTVMFLHEKIVYVLITTSWGYVGYLVPAWSPV